MFVEDIDLLGFDAMPCHWVVSHSLKECIAFVYSAWMWRHDITWKHWETL